MFFELRVVEDALAWAKQYATSQDVTTWLINPFAEVGSAPRPPPAADIKSVAIQKMNSISVAFYLYTENLQHTSIFHPRQRRTEQ